MVSYRQFENSVMMRTATWRSLARIVAIVETISVGISVVLVVALLIFSISLTAGASFVRELIEKKAGDSLPEETTKSIILILEWIFWTITILVILFNCYYGIAANKLLEATRVETKPKVAIIKGRVWKTFNRLALLLAFIGACTNPFGLVYFVWRSCMTIIVFQFVHELEIITVSLPEKVTTEMSQISESTVPVAVIVG